MAYEIHIRRNVDRDEDGPAITLAEWIEAVNSVDGVRLADGHYLITVPDTGQVLRFPNNGGDTEVLFPPDNGWRRVFRWHGGKVTFVAPKDFDDASTLLRLVARALAQALQASVVGDEGEPYP